MEIELWNPKQWSGGAPTFGKAHYGRPLLPLESIGLKKQVRGLPPQILGDVSRGEMDEPLEDTALSKNIVAAATGKMPAHHRLRPPPRRLLTVRRDRHPAACSPLAAIASPLESPPAAYSPSVATAPRRNHRPPPAHHLSWPPPHRNHQPPPVHRPASTALETKTLRTGASEDWWMVAPGCDEWLKTWCGLTLGRVLQVQVATWFVLVQVKSRRERSMPCGAFEE
jgi:hypothetical protein